MILLKFVIIVIIGYIFGSIPFGVFIGKRHAGVDVRRYGSGKMGMSNVMRTAGTKASIAVGILDFGKGALAVFVASLIMDRDYVILGNLSLGVLTAQGLAALAAVAGHIYPVFGKFKGGRGVMTFFGGLAVMSPLVALFGGEIFFIGTFVSRYVSLGSLVGAVSTYLFLVPLTIWSDFPLEYLLYALVGVIILFIMHRDNIGRLVTGKERRLGEKSERISL